jgi:hypothetical protein
MNIVNVYPCAHTHTNRLLLVALSRDVGEVKQIMLRFSRRPSSLIRVHTEIRRNDSSSFYRRGKNY